MNKVIDLTALPEIFGESLPEAHTFFATKAANKIIPSYQAMRKALGLTSASSNRKTWEKFESEYEENTPDTYIVDAIGSNKTTPYSGVLFGITPPKGVSLINILPAEGIRTTKFETTKYSEALLATFIVTPPLGKQILVFSFDDGTAVEKEIEIVESMDFISAAATPNNFSGKAGNYTVPIKVTMDPVNLLYTSTYSFMDSEDIVEPSLSYDLTSSTLEVKATTPPGVYKMRCYAQDMPNEHLDIATITITGE